MLAAQSFPFPYDWSRFPAAWFGGNATDWESSAQMDAIGRYSLAILGWQMLIFSTDWTASIYAQLTQAALIKRAHPALPTFVYANFGGALGFDAATHEIMLQNQYEQFFMQSTDGPEYSHSGCQQMGVPTSDRCMNYYWNFANASAREFFLDKIVAPLAEAPFIDGVFFDGFDTAYTTPEWKPWGRPVVNVPNCSDKGGCELLINGSLEVSAQTARLLNRHGKIPIYANPASFANAEHKHIWLDERRLMRALDGTSWMRYYEFLRAESSYSKGLLPNMLEEAKRGVPAGVHTYYHKTPPNGTREDPTSHMAAFLLARQEQWYYFGSTGWLDSDFVWSPLYDQAAECHKPLEPARSGTGPSARVYTRRFEGCHVTLNCTVSDACVGKIEWATHREVK